MKFPIFGTRECLYSAISPNRRSIRQGTFMRTESISGTDKLIDMRDVIERFEYIEKTEEADEITERDSLKALLDELKGNGGDEQWRGDWYPLTLIRKDQFKKQMDEMLEDIGDLPKNLPCYFEIVMDYDALRVDYCEIEFNGQSYLYR